jgi:hypothetical protein
MHKKPRRVRRTPAQWQDLIDTWTKSSESAVDFARRHRCSAASLYRWRHRLGELGSTVPPPGDLRLLPVVVHEDEDLEAATWWIRTPLGLTVSMHGPGAAAGLQAALRLLLAAETP